MSATGGLQQAHSQGTSIGASTTATPAATAATTATPAAAAPATAPIKLSGTFLTTQDAANGPTVIVDESGRQITLHGIGWYGFNTGCAHFHN